MKKGIVKIRYRKKIENHYGSGDLRAAWQGIKSMAAIYQPTNETRQPTRITGVENADLPDAFVYFRISKAPVRKCPQVNRVTNTSQ